MFSVLKLRWITPVYICKIDFSTHSKIFFWFSLSIYDLKLSPCCYCFLLLFFYTHSTTTRHHHRRSTFIYAFNSLFVDLISSFMYISVLYQRKSLRTRTWCGSHSLPVYVSDVSHLEWDFNIKLLECKCVYC